MSDLEGAILSDYLLLKCISKGGTADVYRAQQHIDGSPKGNYEVAVKVFRPGYAQHKSFRDYFMAEAEKIGQLDHPNILPLLEFGEGDGLLYSVTPFVPTGTLEDLLARVGGKLSTMQALPIMQQLSSAVQYAHDRSVIHGNMKPSNIFIAADGRVLLADFSVTRGYDDSQQSLTRIGWGSAEYSAPEQSLGVLRPASDIYTLGVLLFRLLTGRPPFTGQTPVEVLLKHVRQQAPSARMLAPHISDAVDGVLLVAMQKRSDERFASVQAFSDALAAAATVAPITSPFAQPVASPRVPPGQLSLVETPFTPVPARAGHAWPITPAIQWTSPSSTLGVPTNTSPTQSESGQEASGTSAPQTGNLPGRAHPVVVGVKQVLPAVIVILLLLGLLAALLSSFLYPGGGTHGTGWASRATYVVAVTSSRGKIWQNS